MFKIQGLEYMSIEERYDFMIKTIECQLKDEEDFIANLSNISAIIMSIMDDLNWVGFYLIKERQLVVGPFQGLPACNRIELGKGVCGTAVTEKKVQRVDDVHKFPGHIACDSESNSEIVIPIIKDEEVIAVLDLDSPNFSRFTQSEENALKRVGKLIEEYAI